MKKNVLRLLVTFIYPLIKPYWRLVRTRSQGVKVLLKNNSSVLMIRNTYRQEIWTFPGGGIKKGELPEDAAKREVREEVGIAVQKLIKKGPFISNLEGKQDTIWVFTGILDNTKFEIDTIEIAEAKWQTIQDVTRGQLPLSPIGNNCLKLAGF